MAVPHLTTKRGRVAAIDRVCAHDGGRGNAAPESLGINRRNVPCSPVGAGTLPGRRIAATRYWRSSLSATDPTTLGHTPPIAPSMVPSCQPFALFVHTITDTILIDPGVADGRAGLRRRLDHMI